MLLETAPRERLIEEVIRLRHRNIELEALLEAIELPRKMANFLEDTAIALSSATKEAEPDTGLHSDRVSQLATKMAMAMGLSPRQIESCRIGGILHDIGKIGVDVLPIVVLPRRLDNDEFGLIKMHPEIGYRILNAFTCPWPLAEIAHGHHERLDGSGYPRQKGHRELLTETKLVAVADVVDAMINVRSYRPETPGMVRALEFIWDQRGIQFCPDCVDACVSVFNDGFRFN